MRDSLSTAALLRPVLATMDKRLNRAGEHPLVVALSGGGDSLFLLNVASRWAQGAGRRLLAVTVDHGLQPCAVNWASWCRDRAHRLGVDHTTLVWEGLKPRTGLPAAARMARHSLIAEFARTRGAVVVLMGHTADDAYEARLMRAAGGSTPDPRSWGPSPVWPQGRGIFILRPMMNARRAALRGALAAAGEEWLEDPLNDAPGGARSFARKLLAAGVEVELEVPARIRSREIRALLEVVAIDPAGGVTIRRQALTNSGHEATAAFVGAALLSVSGGARPARSLRLSRLASRLMSREVFTATLSGARIEAISDRATILREAGEMTRARRPLQAELPAGFSLVWDGRYEIQARIAGLAVRPLAGVRSRLAPSESRRLAVFGPAARRAMPAIIDRTGVVSCPLLSPDDRLELRSLVFARLAGALGALTDESAVRRMAPEVQAS